MVHKVAAYLVRAVSKPVGVLVVGRGKQDHRRVDRAGAYGEKACSIDRGVAVVRCRRSIGLGGFGRRAVRFTAAGVDDLHRGDCGASAVGKEAGNA